MTPQQIIIGLDAKRALNNYTGLGAYSRTLINSLLKTDTDKRFLFRLYSPDKGREDLVNKLYKSDNLQFVYPERQKIKIMRDLWREKYIVKNLINDKVNVFHGLSGQLPSNIKGKGIKTIVTIHDLIFMCHPEFYNPIDVQIYKHKFHRTLRQADRIIAISECTKRDIIKYGYVDESKIYVIYQSYSNIFNKQISTDEQRIVTDKYGLPEKFILNVGSVECRKNVLLAVKSMTQLPDDVHIVIIGKYTPYVDKITRFANANNLHNRVHIFNNVPDEDLRIIYALAKIFVYPSVYEGFGIPIIEAIANNLPVIACKGSCLEEAGGEDSYYVDTDDVTAMSDILTMLLNDKNKRMESIVKSKKYIQKFTDTDIAGKVLKLYLN